MSEAPSRHARTSPLARVRGRIHPGVAPILTAAAGIAAMAMVHAVDPNEPGNYPTCPWLAVTGTYCPGCGTMRAVAALSHLDLGGALQMNPLLMALLPIMLAVWARWLYRSFRPSAQPPPLPPTWWLWTLLSAIVGFWILRNLPYFTLLAPGGVPAPLLG